MKNMLHLNLFCNRFKAFTFATVLLMFAILLLNLSSCKKKHTSENNNEEQKTVSVKIKISNQDKQVCSVSFSNNFSLKINASSSNEISMTANLADKIKLVDASCENSNFAIYVDPKEFTVNKDSVVYVNILDKSIKGAVYNIFNNSGIEFTAITKDGDQEIDKLASSQANVRHVINKSGLNDKKLKIFVNSEKAKNIIIKPSDTYTFSDTSPTIINIDIIAGGNKIMAYFVNYDVYRNNINSDGRAIANSAYYVTGTYTTTDTQAGAYCPTTTCTNQDMDQKVQYVDILVYGFLWLNEGINVDPWGFNLKDGRANKIGSIHFSDHWSDLDRNTLKDSWGSNMGLPADEWGPGEIPLVNSDKMNSAEYQVTHSLVKQGAYARNNLALHGQFFAFSKLNNSKNNLKKYISLGGWISPNFNKVLSNATHIKNFVDSYELLVKTARAQGGDIHGIDFDIELGEIKANFPQDMRDRYDQAELKRREDDNKQADHTKWELYIDHLKYLIPDKQDKDKLTFWQVAEEIKKQLNARGIEVELSLTVQANDTLILEPISQKLKEYMDKGVINHIGVMTYDLAGVFDSGRDHGTGLHNNLFSLKADPRPDNERFSIDRAVTSLTKKEIDPDKIFFGLAAYGRAGITNVSETNDGLFQKFDITKVNEVLKGDLDVYECSVNMQPACSGTMQYSYIMQNMIPKGFKAHHWMSDDQKFHIGSTAYNKGSWTPTAPVAVNGIYVKPKGVNPGYQSAYTHGLKDIFISYTAAADAYDFGRYAKEKKLGGVLLWTIAGDLPPDNKDSLISNYIAGYEGKPAPYNGGK